MPGLKLIHVSKRSYLEIWYSVEFHEVASLIGRIISKAFHWSIRRKRNWERYIITIVYGAPHCTFFPVSKQYLNSFVYTKTFNYLQLTNASYQNVIANLNILCIANSAVQCFISSSFRNANPIIKSILVCNVVDDSPGMFFLIRFFRNLEN